MELTEKQAVTIAHLKGVGIDTPEAVINFCKRKLTFPYRSKENRHKPLSITRNHSRKHYLGIIKFLS